MAYPGNRHAYEYFKRALAALLHEWPWTVEQRRQIIVRTDAELGTDANVAYVLWYSFQVLMKGYSGPRTQSWVKRISDPAWSPDPDCGNRWAAPAPAELRLGRRLQAYVLRWRDSDGDLDHATLLSTLGDPVFPLWKAYDGRGGMETEIRSDKSGLELCHRRKHSLNALEGWLILTDVAHNLLAWLRPWMLAGTQFEDYGPKRLVHDLLPIPGCLTFEGDRLTKVALLQSHPFANEMRCCLHKLLVMFELA